MHHIRTKPQSFTYVSPEIRADISNEKMMITRALKYLDIACKQLKRIEDDLSAFLSEYYARVGASFETLEQLRADIAQWERSNAANDVLADHPHSFTLADASSATIDQDIKSIYRGLVKIYHPDSGEEAASSDIIKHINDAYTRRSLSDLRRIEYEVMEEGVHNDVAIGDMIERLKQRYEAIVSSITQVNHRRKTLLGSPAYHLKQRVYNAKLLGYDLISVIESDTREKIEEAKRALAYAKLKAQLKRFAPKEAPEAA